MQPGPRKGTAEIFAITAEAIDEVAGVIDAASALLEEVLRAVAAPASRSPWPSEVLLGTACYHIASPKTGHRVIAAANLTAETFAVALADAARPRSVATDESGEAIRETRLQV